MDRPRDALNFGQRSSAANIRSDLRSACASSGEGRPPSLVATPWAMAATRSISSEANVQGGGAASSTTGHLLDDQPHWKAVADLDGDIGGVDGGELGEEINERPLDRKVSRTVVLQAGALRPQLDLTDYARRRIEHRLAADHPQRVDPAEAGAPD